MELAGAADDEKEESDAVAEDEKLTRSIMKRAQLMKKAIWSMW